jgi:hypothetical protein
MEDQKATHPTAPFLPAQVKVGDWVFLNGDNVEVYSGLYVFQFKEKEGGRGYRYALRRDKPDQVYFQISAAQLGTFEVTGIYASDSPIPPEARSFGTMHISPQD